MVYGAKVFKEPVRNERVFLHAASYWVSLISPLQIERAFVRYIKWNEVSLDILWQAIHPVKRRISWDFTFSILLHRTNNYPFIQNGTYQSLFTGSYPTFCLCVGRTRPHWSDGDHPACHDQSGVNVNEAIPGDGKKYVLRDYWGHSVLSEGGRIYATSAKLTAFQQSTVCIIEGSHVDVQLDSRKTWTFLAGGPVVDLSDATVSCRAS